MRSGRTRVDREHMPLIRPLMPMFRPHMPLIRPHMPLIRQHLPLIRQHLPMFRRRTPLGAPRTAPSARQSNSVHANIAKIPTHATATSPGTATGTPPIFQFSMKATSDAQTTP